MTANECRAFGGGGDKNVLGLDYGDGCIILNVLKAELYFKRVNCMVNSYQYTI